tara:strand:- start:157 stop:636 length:480 start_codon:yes stop_codon:yes gene_type:complete
MKMPWTRRAKDLEEHFEDTVLRIERLESDRVSLEKCVQSIVDMAVELGAMKAHSDGLEAQLREQSNAIGDQTLAISEGIERTDRAERRIKDTVRRARKKLADSGFADDGLDAEAHELQLGDDRGIEPLPAMPTEMAEPTAEASSIRGVSIELLRQVRGY